MRDATLDGDGGGGGRIAAVVTTGFTVWQTSPWHNAPVRKLKH